MATNPARLKKALDETYGGLPEATRVALADELVRLLDKVVAERRPLQPGFQLGFRSIDRTTPLSRALRGFREKAKLTQEEVATRAEWSQSKVVRMENGDVGVSASDVMSFLRICGVRRQTTLTDTLTLAREDRARRRA
ncbi:MAG TPA: helix-turn-helix transcriptional regulator [Candidatus Saccharimonadales bacterium]|nr:helix-turn-helix transcriptional regulator [Candidatus Saccharimonadales bacterium]